MCYLDFTSEGRGLLVVRANDNRTNKRYSISVSHRDGSPQLYFRCDWRGVPFLPVSIVDSGRIIELRGRAKARAVNVALAQCFCLSLALLRTPASFSLAACRPVGYKRKEAARFPLTNECLTHLGLLTAGGDPSANVATRADGFSVMNFGSIDCSNVRAAAARTFFETKDRKLVRLATSKEAELEVLKRPLQRFTMDSFILAVAGGAPGAMDLPCCLSNPAAAIKLMAGKSFAVDVKQAAAKDLPPDAKVRVDVDLAVLLITGFSSHFMDFRLVQEAALEVVEPISEFEEFVRSACRPIAEKYVAEAHRQVLRDTPYIRSVMRFSEATHADGYGSVPNDALFAVRYILSTSPLHWRDEQTCVHDSFKDFVQYSSTGKGKFEHCRWAFAADCGKFTLLDGFRDSVSEPTQALVRVSPHMAQECARDVLMAFKVENESPADFAKLIASRGAPTGSYVTIRGNSKLFILSILVLILNRCEREFGIDFATEEIVGAVQVISYLHVHKCGSFAIHQFCCYYFLKVYNSKTRGLSTYVDADIGVLVRTFGGRSSVGLSADEDVEVAAQGSALNAVRASSKVLFDRMMQSSAVAVVGKAFTLHEESTISIGVQVRANGSGMTMLKPVSTHARSVHFGLAALDDAGSLIPSVDGSASVVELPEPLIFETAVNYNVLGLPHVINGTMIRFPKSDDPDMKIRANQNYFQGARYHSSGNF